MITGTPERRMATTHDTSTFATSRLKHFSRSLNYRIAMIDVRIPVCLTRSDVTSKRKWRKILKAMVGNGFWDNSIIDELDGWDSLGESNKPIMLFRPTHIAPKDHMPVYTVVADSLAEIAYEKFGSRGQGRERAAQFLENCIITNIDQLWFSLGLLDSFCLPTHTKSFDKQDDLYRLILKNHLYFWDWYCSHQGRFFTGIAELFNSDNIYECTQDAQLQHWYFWGNFPRILCAKIGKTLEDVNSLSQMLPKDAGDLMSSWMENYEDENGPIGEERKL